MPKNYTISELTEEEFLPLFKKHGKSIFKETHSYTFHDILSDTEKKRIKELDLQTAKPYKLYLGVFDKNKKFVGWSWGYQENATTFYMVNSAVLNSHRRKGIYSALIEKCISILTKKGFQLIYSRHCATNNAVIIPKLKAGFLISKMEIDDKFGVLIHLHFFTNKARRQIMDYRAGQSKPDAKTKKLFNM